MDAMNGRDREWAEALRGGEPSPTDGEWAARRRALHEAVAKSSAAPARRRVGAWIPAAAAAGVLAVWGAHFWSAKPPAEPALDVPPVATAAAPAPEALRETLVLAGDLASGVADAIDGSVPLAGRLMEEAGRRWIAAPLMGRAERMVDAVRADTRAAARELIAWTGDTRKF